MPRAATGYRSLLRTHGAAAFFFTAAAGRVGIAMTGLGLVWLLHARTGSYGTAGLAAAPSGPASCQPPSRWSRWPTPPLSFSGPSWSPCSARPVTRPWPAPSPRA